MNLDQIYDSSKRGTIVIGSPRSGTHHISSLVSLELRRNNIATPSKKPEEFFYDLSHARSIMLGEPEYLNSIIPSSSDYVVGSIVSPHARLALSNYLERNFHLVRVIREDVVAHLMSVIIHKRITMSDALASNRVTSDQFNGLFKDNRHRVTAGDIYYFTSLLLMDKTTAAATLVYEDYMNLLSEETKSQVTLTPEEFFINYDETKLMLHHVGLGK